MFVGLRPLTAAPRGIAVEYTMWLRWAKRFCRELNSVSF